MFRLSQFMRELIEPTPVRHAKPPGPVVIWNLIRRCNLNCIHCYSLSTDVDFPGELTTAEVFTVMADLKAAHAAAAEIKGRLLAPATLTDEQHADDEVALAAATRTAGRLTDAVRQLEAARPALVEAEAKRQGEAARAAFRCDVDAVATRSAALTARIQAEYPAAAATLRKVVVFPDENIVTGPTGKVRKFLMRQRHLAEMANA